MSHEPSVILCISLFGAIGNASCREKNQQSVVDPVPTSNAVVSVQVPTREPELPAALPAQSNGGKSEPIATTTGAAKASSSAIAKAALGGPVADLIIRKKFEAARNLCLQAVDSGKLFSMSDFLACRQACRGEPDENPSIPSDPSCFSSLQYAKQP
jgi:hypothetical protein